MTAALTFEARHALADRGADFYETPACATRALIAQPAFLRSHVRAAAMTIWEPCAGRGAISRVLIANGRRVVAQDLNAWDGRDDGIATRIDFLMERRAPEDAGLIVTNPPYMLAEAFIRHGIGLGLPGWYLLRLNFLQAVGRSDLIDLHLAQVLAFADRLPMMHREGWTGKKAGSAVAHAWFYFSPRPRFCPSGGERDPIHLSRILAKAHA